MQTQRSGQANAVARCRAAPPRSNFRLLLICLSLLLALLAAGTVGAAFLSFVELQKDGINGVDGLDGISAVAISPDGRHVYTTSTVDSAVAAFSRNMTTGALTFIEARHAGGAGGIIGLSGARSVAVSPDGRHVYVAGEGGDALVVFNRNATSGELTFVESQQDGIGGVDGLDGTASVDVSSDGRHVYAVGANDNALVAFSRNAATGALTFVEAQQDGIGGVDGLAGAFDVAVSPDGGHVYTAGRNDNALAVFSRNTVTGALTFVEIKRAESGGVNSLSFAQSVTVSPDNRHVYATGIISVAVFSRNTTSGALTLVEAQRDGINGVDDLAGAHDVAVSPDGTHVYVTGAVDNAVSVFRRNTATGALLFVEAQKDGAGGVDGLAFVNSVTVSPNNRHVYTGGGNDDALAVFSTPATSQRVFLPLLTLPL